MFGIPAVINFEEEETLVDQEQILSPNKWSRDDLNNYIISEPAKPSDEYRV
jgi:hypothetical protein